MVPGRWGAPGKRLLSRAALLGIDCSVHITKAGSSGVSRSKDSLIIMVWDLTEKQVSRGREAVEKRDKGEGQGMGLVECSGIGYHFSWGY